jgi:hypothetical protein
LWACFGALQTAEEINTMAFKKGDKVRTEDGHMGEILFIDKDGIEAQVALERISVRLRTDTLRVFDENDETADSSDAGSKRPTNSSKTARRGPKK